MRPACWVWEEVEEEGEEKEQEENMKEKEEEVVVMVGMAVGEEEMRIKQPIIDTMRRSFLGPGRGGGRGSRVGGGGGGCRGGDGNDTLSTQRRWICRVAVGAEKRRKRKGNWYWVFGRKWGWHHV